MRNQYPFSMSSEGKTTFHDYNTGHIINNYEGLFYNHGHLDSVMKTWLSEGERHFAAQ